MTFKASFVSIQNILSQMCVILQKNGSRLLNNCKKPEL